MCEFMESWKIAYDLCLIDTIQKVGTSPSVLPQQQNMGKQKKSCYKLTGLKEGIDMAYLMANLRLKGLHCTV